ncbi:MAG: TerD family protein [Pseudobdellovibrionaceae bacterium]
MANPLPPSLHDKTIPLDISPEGARRLLVGLSWEPLLEPKLTTEEKKSLWARLALTWKLMPGNRGGYTGYAAKHQREWRKDEDKSSREKDYPHYDLDLLCLVFDNDKNLQVTIGPDPDILIDDLSTIYHSGENSTGSGGIADDEQIHIETASVPDSYQHFFFIVLSDCKFDLGEIDSLKIRIADSKTEKNFLTLDIMPPEHTALKTGYLFAHIFRDGDNWKALPIEQFDAFEADWPALCASLIPTKR